MRPKKNIIRMTEMGDKIIEYEMGKTIEDYYLVY